MFNILKRKANGETVTFKIEGMHCTSCAMNIDGELEDTEGVTSATTSYAKSKTVITYDPSKVTQDKLKQVIESLEYSVGELAK
jgi:copper chaperone CopZ